MKRLLSLNNLVNNPSSLLSSANAQQAMPFHVASWNLENFDASNGNKVERIAAAISGALNCPHILAVQELCGAATDDASQINPNASALITAIEALSGRHYAYCEALLTDAALKPKHDIRCGYFYRTDRVKLREPLPGPVDPFSRSTFMRDPKGVHLCSANPQPLAQGLPSFSRGRYPLAAQLEDMLTNECYSIVNVHLKANTSLYGGQPAGKGEIDQIRRIQQSQAEFIRRYTQSLRNAHPPSITEATHHIILCGDFNMTDREMRINGKPPAIASMLQIVDRCGLERVSAELPRGSSHRLRGLTSNIDHFYVSLGLKGRLSMQRPVLNHGDALNRLSDHNPTMAEICAPLHDRCLPDGTMAAALSVLGWAR